LGENLSLRLVKPILKLNTKVMIAVLFVVSLSFYLFTCEQVSASKATGKLSALSGAGLSSISTITSSNDTNWAGYIVASDLQNPQASVTDISAIWTVPRVTISSQNTFSAVWIGIGGYFDKTLIQTGTEQDSIQGQSEYYAWFELLPQDSVTIDSMIISPGDQINASIHLLDVKTNQWSIHIEDLTKNQEYTSSFTYASPKLSAEWMVERPEITSRRSGGTLTSLADVGAVEFADCQTTIADETGTIGNFPKIQVTMYQMVQSRTDFGSTQLVAVSDLMGNGSGFTVETSPSAIPELPVLILLPLFVGTSLLATITGERMWRFQN
jgi:hypothetical protein